MPRPLKPTALEQPKLPGMEEALLNVDVRIGELRLAMSSDMFGEDTCKERLLGTLESVSSGMKKLYLETKALKAGSIPKAPAVASRYQKIVARCASVLRQMPESERTKAEDRARAYLQSGEKRLTCKELLESLEDNKDMPTTLTGWIAEDSKLFPDHPLTLDLTRKVNKIMFGIAEPYFEY